MLSNSTCRISVYEFPVFKGFHEENGRKTDHKKKHIILTDSGADRDAVDAARGGPRDCGGATEPLNVSGYVGAELGAAERGSEGRARLLERLLSF